MTLETRLIRFVISKILALALALASALVQKH
jgi:hypothetical protein